MLVDVLKPLQYPERMTQCVLPSVVRLQSLDDCQSRIGNIFETTRSTRIESEFLNENGEGGLGRFFIRQLPPMAQGESVDEMVETTPEIVKAVSDERSDIVWHR